MYRGRSVTSPTFERWQTWDEPDGSSSGWYMEGETSEIDVSVSSDFTQEMPSVGGNGYLPNAIPGDDNRDSPGITLGSTLYYNRPMRNLTKAVQRYRGARDGLRIRFHLHGYGGPQNGALGPCTGTLFYQNQFWPFDGGKTTESAISYWGPPGKLVVSDLGHPNGSTLDSGIYPGSYTVVQFPALSFTTDQHALIGARLRTLKADGSLLHFDIPVFRNTTSDIWIPDQGAMGNGGGIINNTHTIQIVRNAVNVVTPGDNDTILEGFGNVRAGFTGPGKDANYRNPEPALAWIDFSGMQVRASGINIVECGSLDHPMTIMGDLVGLFNHRCDANLHWLGGSSRVFGYMNATGNYPDNEKASYAHPSFAPQFDHCGIDAHMGIRSAAVKSGVIYVGGTGPNPYDMAPLSGHLTAYRGFSSYNSPTTISALRVTGRGIFTMHSNAVTGEGASLHIHGCNHGVWADDAAHLNLLLAGLRIDNNSGDALRVGDGTTKNATKAMTLAAFNAAPHLCNFSPDTGAGSSGCTAIIRGR